MTILPNDTDQRGQKALALVDRAEQENQQQLEAVA